MIKGSYSIKVFLNKTGDGYGSGYTYQIIDEDKKKILASHTPVCNKPEEAIPYAIRYLKCYIE